MAARAQLGITVFVVAGGLHRPPQLLCHGLHAITDAQHRHTQFEHGLRRTRRIFLGHRSGTARKNHPGGCEVAYELIGDVVWVQFAIDIGLAHTAGDELGVLGTEVEDEDALVHGELAVSSWQLAAINRQSL